MALRAAIELKVFDIIASCGPEAQLSSDEIISKLPTKHPKASNTLERILRLLGVSSILTMSSRQCKNDNNKTETTYGLTRETRSLVTNAHGVSASP
ncbi:hypothetical protein, partial [Salmonella sp. s58078]|uniref:methyltransferase family protein n=1 Tax=Salmonella sp. s58078 TaxID=3159699 RepID=UPI003980D203